MMRKLEHPVTVGKIEGERSRGRQKIKIPEGPAAWLGKSSLAREEQNCHKTPGIMGNGGS